MNMFGRLYKKYNHTKLHEVCGINETDKYVYFVVILDVVKYGKSEIVRHEVFIKKLGDGYGSCRLISTGTELYKQIQNIGHSIEAILSLNLKNNK